MTCRGKIILWPQVKNVFLQLLICGHILLICSLVLVKLWPHQFVPSFYVNNGHVVLISSIILVTLWL